MEGGPGSLLAQAMAAGSRSSSPNNRRAPPATYLDARSGMQLSSAKSPAARAQTAPVHGQHWQARCSSPPRHRDHQQRAQTAAGKPAGSTAIRASRRPRWNGSVAAPVAPSFEEALQGWQADVVAGMYAPRCLGSLAALAHSGRVSPATAAAPSSSSPCGASAAATSPAVFQGSGEDALQALEGLVARLLVARPHLTLMQLQGGVRAISQLDSACQLAAICELLRGGCWLAAMQVAHADGLTVLSGVLAEMRALVELGMAWQDQHLAAAAWRWAPIDRDLFLHTFRQSALTGQYQQLRRQLTRLQHMQAQTQQRQQQQPRTPLAAAGSLGSGPAALWSCPELARAERFMLVSIIDRYLESIAAATAASTHQQLQPAAAGSVGCYKRLAGAASKAPPAAPEVHPSSTDGGCHSSLRISSDWRLVVLEEAAEPHSGDGSGSSSSSNSSSAEAHVPAVPAEANGAPPELQPQLDASAPQPPAAPCSRPQSHQTSRRCSTAQGSRPATAGALNSARLGQQHLSESSNVPSGVQQGSPSAPAFVSSTAGEQLRPGSAAAGSGPSRLGTGSASGPLSRGRPGSAVTASPGLASRGDAATSSGAADTWQRPGSAAADANLCRLRDSCAQQRQGIEQWAEQLAHAASVGQFGEGSSRDSGGAATAASRPGSAALASLGFVQNSRPGTALTAASSSRSRCSRPASALTQQPNGRCSLSSSCAAELLLSSSKALVSSPATRQPSSDADASARSHSSAAAASRPTSQPGTAALASIAAAAGSSGGSRIKQPHTKLKRRASPSPVPHLPLLEAGVISPDPSDDGDGDNARAGSGGAPAAASQPGAWLYGAVGHSRAPAAQAGPPAKASALGLLFGSPSSSKPKQKGRKPAAKPSGPAATPQQQHKPRAAATKQPEHALPTSSTETAKADGVPSSECTAAASALEAAASHHASSPVVVAQPGADAAAAAVPGVQAAAADQPPGAAEPSALQAAEEAATLADQPPVAAAAAGAPVEGARAQLSEALGVPASLPGPDQLMVELAETMQQFQQQLKQLKQQTACMAEELLARQVAGQAARQAGGTGSSSNSRPVSAVAGQQQPRTSSRPASRGQPVSARLLLQGHAPAAAVAAAAAGAPADATGLGATPSQQPLHAAAAAAALLACQAQLAAQLGGMTLLLEGEEAPSAADVAAYARYLGMDPQQDAHLLHIAEAALLAPLPAGWTVHLDARGNEYFCCGATQQSSYEHPMDGFHRQLYAQQKAADAVVRPRG